MSFQFLNFSQSNQIFCSFGKKSVPNRLHQHHGGELPEGGSEVEIIDGVTPAVFDTEGVAIEVVEGSAPTVFDTYGIILEKQEFRTPFVLLIDGLSQSRGGEAKE